MNKILLITLSGPDQPGITSGVSSLLAAHRIDVLDIGQSVIHSSLTIGLLVEIPDAAAEEGLVPELEAFVAERGLRLKLGEVEPESYGDWVEAGGSPRYIITLLARKISADQLARVCSVMPSFGLNIDGITRLSGRIPLGVMPRLSRACVEFSVRGELEDPVAFRAKLLEVAGALEVDLAFQEDNRYRRNRRLVVFDMDSTLIEAEVIDELAKAAGVGDEVSEITERAMRGELDFQASFRERVALLKGLPEDTLQHIAGELKVTEGAAHLITTLRALGYKTAILSGGFTYFARYLQEQLGIDHVFANALDIVDGKVTGEVREPIVDGERKAELLRQLAAEQGIELEQVIAVGDGANDLPMLSIAGLGVAFRAKPLVKQSAEQSISTLGLDAILYLLGIGDRHQVG